MEGEKNGNKSSIKTGTVWWVEERYCIRSDTIVIYRIDIKDFALLMHAVFSIRCSETADFTICRVQTNCCENFSSVLKLLIIMNRAAVISTEPMTSGDTYVSAIARNSHLEGYYIEF